MRILVRTHDIWTHDGKNLPAMRVDIVASRELGDRWGGTRRKGPGGKQLQGSCQGDSGGSVWASGQPGSSMQTNSAQYR